MIITSKVKMLITAFVRILSQWEKDISSLPYTVKTTYYIETQGKIQKIRPYIDSCAFGGLQSKRTQSKTYPRQNVPSWSQKLVK